jgi:predicted nucleotidyltransferase
MSRRPEILKVFLFGSLVQGNWTADSDADLIVVVRKEFSDIFERSRYQIHTESISTDTLVYSQTEFDQLCRNPSSLLAQNLSVAVELGLSAD